MKLTAIMPVRNEQWVLGLSARACLEWCDELIVLLHRSTDRSAGILEEIRHELPAEKRILSAASDDERWREMDHRQSLLTVARNGGATHIALVDADEVLCGDSLPRVRAISEALKPGECLNVRMHCMWRGLHQYRVDQSSVWSNRRDLALVFRDKPELHWTAENGYHHHARAPKGAKPSGDQTLGVMHLQFADWRRLTAKHALYKVRERIDYPDKPVGHIESMYNMALDEQYLETRYAPRQWTEIYREKDWLRYVDFNDTPWQEAEARRLFVGRGPLFRGLNLFGVCAQ